MARARHQRTTPLLRLLARLGWQRDPDLWTVRCRDQYGRRAQVQVHLTETGIRIVTSTAEPLELTPSEAGGLRAALRDGVLSLSQLAGPDGLRSSTHVPRDAPPPNPRQRIRLHRPHRPTVADIAARLAQGDAPTGTYPAPRSLHLPRAEQRPMTIHRPSPGMASVRAIRLAADGV